MQVNRANPHVLNTVEIASKIASSGALFVFLAYAIGYFKASILYYRLDAAWVIDFHSVQDFIVRGFAAVLLPAAVAALILVFDIKSKTQWWLIGLFAFLSALATALFSIFFDPSYQEVSARSASLLERIIYYILCGSFLANLIRTVQEGAVISIRVVALLTVLLYLCLLSDGLAGQSVISRINAPRPGITMVTIAGDRKLYVLLNGVNAKYLVAECGNSRNIRLLESGDKMHLFPSLNYGCPPTVTKLRNAPELYRLLTQAPGRVVIPRKAN